MNDGLKTIFNHIYETNQWEHGSGFGSKPENVLPYIQFLFTMIERYSIKSIVDIGCGDWQFSRLLNWEGFQYLGIDVSSYVINSNISQFQSENVRFLCGEVFDVPDIEKYDLVLIKDVFQHLSHASILKILNCVKQNKYLLITNDTTRENRDINDGDGWPVNVCLPPFNLVPTHRIMYMVEPRMKASLFIKQPQPSYQHTDYTLLHSI